MRIISYYNYKYLKKKAQRVGQGSAIDSVNYSNSGFKLNLVRVGLLQGLG